MHAIFRVIILAIFGSIILGTREAAAAPTNSSTNSVQSVSSANTNAVGIFTSPVTFWATPPDLRPFQLILPKAHFFGDWYGLSPLLDSHGISPSADFISDLAGNPVGGKTQAFTHADNLGINLLLDLDKLAGIHGASFLVSMSERDGNSLSHNYVGNVFTIQQDYGGETFKIIDLAYKQKLLDDRIEFQVGRLAAGDDFLVSPYDWVFMQNAFDGNPVGIFFNSPGMTAYPNSAWGTLLKVRPSPRTYVMGAVYNGDPNIRSNDHNGVDMSMHGPVFAIVEAAYQKNGLPMDAGLIGNYRIGAWYDNSSYEDFRSAGYGKPVNYQRGNWGLYTLDDQVLVAFGNRSRNSGLGICASALVSPNQSISQLPYFFTAGVVARGFLNSRPTDLAGFGAVFGEFSDQLRFAEEREQLFNPTIGAQNNETVLELTYRFFFRNDSVFFQPDIQYVIKPGGTGNIQNALVLGGQIGVNF